jgi:hypothetical protein
MMTAAIGGVAWNCYAYAAARRDVYTEPISSSDGHTYVGFSADAQQHLAELRRSMPDPSKVRAYCSGYSNQQLQAEQGRITADTAMWRSEGIAIQGSSAGGLPDMLVSVMVDKPTQETLNRLRARYGPIVGRVEAGPLQNYDNGLSQGLPTPSSP